MLPITSPNVNVRVCIVVEGGGARQTFQAQGEDTLSRVSVCVCAQGGKGAGTDVPGPGGWSTRVCVSVCVCVCAV